MSHEPCFSQTYAEAREKFLSAAAKAGARTHAHVSPHKGPDGGELAMDVARLGPDDARTVILITSGTHGVEGYCGSGCQIALLRDGLAAQRADDTAVVLVHAINPYGFAHMRRMNEDNVDCNRNFIDHAKPPENAAYERVHAMLIPTDWDGAARRAADAAIDAYIAEHGLWRFQQDVTGGQYRHPDGLFFGGSGPVWSNDAFRRVVHDEASRAEHVVYVDLHTGLGPSGVGEAIYIGEGGGAEHARALKLFGDDLTSIDQGTSTSARVTGALSDAVRAEAPQAIHTCMALEYGTYEVPRVLAALRADNWLHVHGDRDSALGREIRRETRDAFYVDDPAWKEQVTERMFDIWRKVAAALPAQVA